MSTIFVLAVVEIIHLISWAVFYFAGKQNGNLLLGVTLPVERMSDPPVRRMVAEYLRQIKWAHLAIILGSALLCWRAPDRFLMILLFPLIFVALLVGGLIYRSHTKKMYAYKRQQNILVGKPAQVTVDTVASSLQGRQAISWWWYLAPTLIGALPLLLHLTNRRFQEAVPLPFALLPLALVGCSTLMQATMTRERTRVISSDTRLNQLANRIYQRAWSMVSFELAMLSATVFGLLIWLGHFGSGNGIAPVCILYLVAVTGMMLAHYQGVRKKTNQLLALAQEQVVVDEDVYWQSGFYNNPGDPRIMVTKRLGMGTTINMGNPKGRIIMILTVSLIALVILGLMGMFAVIETSDFSLHRQGDTIYTRAPLYNTSFALEEVVEVRLEPGLAGGGVRTNGYGGAQVSLGHFRTQDYGPALLYTYAESPPYLVIVLPERVIIINSRDPGKTQKMAEMLQKQSAGR